MADPGRRGHARVRTPEEKVEGLVAHVEAAKEEILRSDFWREMQRRMQQSEEDALEIAGNDARCATWDTIREVVVIGLGSLEASIASRFQLALALLLVAGFDQIQEPILARDPCFTPLDRQVLTDLGCKVVDSDEEAFHRVSQPTLFYMPHCPSSMSHNVLAANWTGDALRQIVMLGNSFVRLTEAWYSNPTRRKEKVRDAPAIVHLVDSKDVVDTPIGECKFAIRGAFNDTSIMMFPTFSSKHPQVAPRSLSHLLPST